MIVSQTCSSSDRAITPLKYSLSLIRPCFRTSANPDRNSISGSVFRNSGLMITFVGDLKTPIWFFKPSKSIPSFPPILASTWERRVVGILMNLMPRLYVLAQNPPISPITPPPRFIRILFLSSFVSVILCQICAQVSRFLYVSPAGMRITLSVSSRGIRGRQCLSVFSSTSRADREYSSEER